MTDKQELDCLTLYTLQCAIKEIEWLTRLLHRELPSAEGVIALVKANILLIEERQ